MDSLNNLLVIAALSSFGFLLLSGLPTVNVDNLISPSLQHPDLLPAALPVMLLSLVFHNVIPTVVNQQECSPTRVRTSVVAGSFLPFIMFVMYNYCVLGNVGPMASGEGFDPVEVLKRQADNPYLGVAVKAFSELAVVTSLIGFVYGLRDAVGDILNLPDQDTEEYRAWKPLVYGLVMGPPLGLTVLTGGDAFLEALDFGAVYGVSLLFLVLPPLMVWKVRGEWEEGMVGPLVPGGIWTLGGMVVTAAGVVGGKVWGDLQGVLDGGGI